MSRLIEAIDAVAPSWAWLMLSIVWQSTLVVLVVAIVAWLWRRASPAVRYWLWQIAALKLLLVPLWTVALPLPELEQARWLLTAPPSETPHAVLQLPENLVADPTEPPLDIEQIVLDGIPLDTTPAEPLDSPPPGRVATAPPLSETPHGRALADRSPTDESPADERPVDDQIALAEEPAPGKPTPTGPKDAALPAEVAPSTRLSWQGWLLVVWLAVLLFEAIQLLFVRQRLNQLLAAAQPADAALARLVDDAATRLKLARLPQTLLTDEPCSPFVTGIFRPKLVLGRQAYASLTGDQLLSVVLHELAHLKRWDLLWGWIPEIACRVYFFHPLAYWIRYSVRLERELACDQAALAHGGRSAAEYAELLVRVVASNVERPLLRAGTAGLDGGDTAPQPPSPPPVS